MPRVPYIPRELPNRQPDSCEKCPLVGLLPKEERREGVRERYCCLGIYEAVIDEDGNPVLDENGVQKMDFPRIKSKGIRVSATDLKNRNQRLHRPCDYIWDAWMTLPGRMFGILAETYNKYRLPFEREQQIKMYPQFKFRTRKKKS